VPKVFKLRGFENHATSIRLSLLQPREALDDPPPEILHALYLSTNSSGDRSIEEDNFS